MSIEQHAAKLRNRWDQLASRDALWAVLTWSGKSGGRWDTAEFFATGEREIASALAELDKRGLMPKARDKALDFGCGAGRLTQALGRRFSTATGVDISAEMIARANSHNQMRNVSFVHYEGSDLTPITQEKRDLIYSNIVLQHVPPQLQEQYVKAFIAGLATDGIALFQIPEKATLSLKGLLIRVLPTVVLDWLRKGMQMHASAPTTVERWVNEAGGQVLARFQYVAEGQEGWVSWYYAAAKKDSLKSPAR